MYVSSKAYTKHIINQAISFIINLGCCHVCVKQSTNQTHHSSGYLLHHKLGVLPFVCMNHNTYESSSFIMSMYALSFHHLHKFGRCCDCINHNIFHYIPNTSYATSVYTSSQPAHKSAAYDVILEGSTWSSKFYLS